jgi:hypothetical protein
MRRSERAPCNAGPSTGADLAMMTFDRTHLTDALVLESGGWHSAYARVLLTVADENVGFVLVDGNGDGAELEMEYWCRGDNGWEAGSSTGEGPLDDLETKRWDAGDMVCAVGRGVPGESMLLRYDEADCECPVNQFGLWALCGR